MCLALTLAVLAGAAPAVQAQLAGQLGLLTGENAGKYLAPLPDALSATMNSAIFTSGKVPKARPEFSIGVRVMRVPFGAGERVFTPTDPPGFTSVPPVQPVPTVVGNGAPVLQSGRGGAVVYYPGGFDLGRLTFAVPQLTVGSVMGTRAVLRWFAWDFAAGDLIERIHVFGIGAQHSLSQYLPGMPVDLALGAFYQTFDINGSLLESSAFHVDVTGSREFGVLQPFASLGLDTFRMNARYQDAADPNLRVAVDFDRGSNLHLAAGVLARLGVVTLHAEANRAAKNGIAAGLGLGR